MHVGPRSGGQAPTNPAIYVTLSADDYLAVADLAQRDGVSMSTYTRILIRRHLERLQGTA